MKHTLTRIAAACLLLAGSIILSQCGGGFASNMKASSFTPHQLAMKSRAALSGHYKSNQASRKLNIKRFSPSSVLARFR